MSYLKLYPINKLNFEIQEILENPEILKKFFKKKFEMNWDFILNLEFKNDNVFALDILNWKVFEVNINLNNQLNEILQKIKNTKLLFEIKQLDFFKNTILKNKITNKSKALIIKTEEPDFIIKQENKLIGVEVTKAGRRDTIIFDEKSEKFNNNYIKMKKELDKVKDINISIDNREGFSSIRFNDAISNNHDIFINIFESSLKNKLKKMKKYFEKYQFSNFYLLINSKIGFRIEKMAVINSLFLNYSKSYVTGNQIRLYRKQFDRPVDYLNSLVQQSFPNFYNKINIFIISNDLEDDYMEVISKGQRFPYEVQKIISLKSSKSIIANYFILDNNQMRHWILRQKKNKPLNHKTNLFRKYLKLK